MQNNSAVFRVVARDALTGVAASIAVGLLTALVLAALVLLPTLVRAAEPDALPEVRMNDVHSGSLLFRTTQAGLYRHAPTLHTDVKIKVSGMVARAKVVQRFTNPGKEWVEGVYVFPLPENAAVDHMRLRVGERVIEGQIKEKGEAKRTYEKAKRAGKKASLLEQERPNVFTTSVANIGPGEEVTVEIEYQQTLRYDQGKFSLRFPMVVAPRYIPGKPVTTEETVSGFDGTGWAQNTDQVPDASRITPPVLHPSKGRINPVSLQVQLDAGFPIARLDSPYHQINRVGEGTGRMNITLADGEVPADRDFVLDWWPEAGTAPRAAMFTEGQGKDLYSLVMVLPPKASSAAAPRLPREVIYIIDTSGSMGGQSIEQARQALNMALDRLTPADRFNVIQFNSVTNKVFASAQPADAMHLAQAHRYVNGLYATGGTEMMPALTAALDGSSDSGRVRQVVFLTDGAVGNESALFDLIKKRLGDSRLFTVGIGSAPNSHFMTKAAQFGRGTFTYIGKVSEVAEKMQELFSKLESPVLTNIKLTWPEGRQAEVWPKRLPDLYMGEPLVFTARLQPGAGSLEVSGKQGQDTWHAKLPLSGGRNGPGVAALWARSKIAALMDSVHDGADAAQVRKDVIDVALRHHLVSKYTSLVAVDVTPSRPMDKTLHKGAVPTNLPHGWKYEKVFGLPQTATAAPLQLRVGMLLLVIALGLMFMARGRKA